MPRIESGLVGKIDAPLITSGALKIQELLATPKFPEASIARVEINGKNELVRNTNSNAFYYIEEGLGVFSLETDGTMQDSEVKKGDLALVRQGTAFQDRGNMSMLAIYLPAFNVGQVEEVNQFENPRGVTTSSRVITKEQSRLEVRPTFSYRVPVEFAEDLGVSIIIGDINPNGESPPKRMIGATRIYTVIGGSGEFLINGEKYIAEKDNVFLTTPGGVYSFKAGKDGMKLCEVNVLIKDYQPGDPLYELVD